jgi:signal transduction histidine kinase
LSEIELRHAQKLESLGALSAGIAHEINTPMQYIGDNLHFIHDSFGAMLEAMSGYAELRAAARAAGVDAQLLERVAEAEAAADFDYVRERLPRAIARALEGVRRVSAIVEAMRCFSHTPAQMSPTDLNQCIRSTLLVAVNEYKYVADVETDLRPLPPVTCNGSDINQVVLNLLVNAAHAVEARHGKGRGTIRIATRADREQVTITVGDDGCGIPADIRHRVFDPFFTTKEVGKGTGQGLAIARALIVDRHGGSITFQSAVGQGTTFDIRLPLHRATS